MKRALLCAVAALATVVPAHAEPTEAFIVAVPGSYEGGYATQAVPMRRGDALTFLNGDLTFHTVAAVDFGSDEASWCGPIDPAKPEHPVSNPRRFPRGGCPLFFSDLVLHAAIATDREPPVVGSARVMGTETLQDRPYEFYCTFHDDMTGVLLVFDA